MPFDESLDQAEGLRKLLTRSSLRIIPVVGACQGVGATSVVINLAYAMAGSGKQVLVLDENLTADNVANRLQLKPRYDLLNSVRDSMRVREIMLRSIYGVHILPAARAIQAIPELKQAESDALQLNLAAAASGKDVILVDSCVVGHSICEHMDAEDPLLIVLDGTTTGITEGYALLKKLSLQMKHERFGILVNRVQGRDEARRIYENMLSLAKKNLNVKLEFLGCIPFDRECGKVSPSGHAGTAMMRNERVAVAFEELADSLLAPAGHDGNRAFSQLMSRLLGSRNMLAGCRTAWNGLAGNR